MADHLCVKCLRETCPNAGYDTGITKCTYYISSKPITNADRIRSMTDDELAEKLASHVRCDMCPRWPMKCEEKCTKYWLDWLRQEAKENEI